MKSIALISILLAVVFAAIAGDFSVGGYVKNFNTVVYPPKVDGIPLLSMSEITGASSYRINLKATYSPADFLTLKVSYDLIPRFTGEMMNYLEGESDEGSRDIASYRIGDITRVISPGDYDGTGFALMQNLDRAMIALHLPLADIELGRQPIAWGSARTVNPTDVLSPFSYDALDIEERPGVDAARIRIPLGTMSEIDAGYLPGYKFNKWKMTDAIFARTKLYFLETDVSATVISFRDNTLYGLDIARAIGGAGTWLEAAHVEVRDVGTIVQDGSYRTIHEPFLRLTAGADYILGDGTYIFGEYHFNGAGVERPEDYTANTDNIAYNECGVYLMGKHYAIGGVAYPVTPLLSASLNCMWNLNDNSALITPNLEYNFAQDVYISLGANIGFGEGGIDGESLALVGKSEFGIYPDMWFMSFRVYF
jgi:hypothetical protein